MSLSHAPRSTSHRGLLAGLLALVLFASTAVAMTANGAGVTSPPALPRADVGAAAPGGAVADASAEVAAAAADPPPTARPRPDDGEAAQLAMRGDAGEAAQLAMRGDAGGGGAPDAMRGDGDGGRRDVVARGGRGR